MEPAFFARRLRASSAYLRSAYPACFARALKHESFHSNHSIEAASRSVAISSEIAAA